MPNLLDNLGTFFTFQTFSDRGEDRDLARVFHGSLQQHHASLKALNDEGAGVFFTVNEADGKGRKAENITRIRAVFVDLDEPDVNRTFDFALPPSHTIESSPGKHHVYWVLADYMPLEQFKIVQQKLAALLGGDQVCCDLPRVLRVPGFLHLKSEPFTVREIGGNAQKYKVSDIMEWVGDVNLPVPTKASDAAFVEGSRNNDLFLYCRRLRIQGLNDHEVELLGLAQAAACSPPLSESEARTVIASSANYTAIDGAEIARLAGLSILDYQRIRTGAAKAQGIQVSALDKIVQDARKKEETADGDSLFPDVTPWDESVNLVELLDEISKTIKRFITMDGHLADLAALWISASWFVDVVKIAPLIIINAPAKGCGKTQFLKLLTELTPRALACSGATSAALFRSIELYRPTLFLDEVDTMFKENDDLRQIFNAGHERGKNAGILRTVGDDHTPKRFNVFGFKAMAGINAIKFAETTTSRALIMNLRRKKPDESTEILRHADPREFELLRARLARCVLDFSEAVKNARFASSLQNRDYDNMEPLLQVAEVAGNFWPETAIAAASKMFGERDCEDTADELLADIREIFEVKRVDRISLNDLLSTLLQDDEGPWGTYERGRPLTLRQLSRKLAAYGIKAKTARISGKSAKSYEFSQFTEVFSRYLAPALPEKTIRSVTKSLKPSPMLDLACNRTVTEKKSFGYRFIEKPRNVLFMSVPSVTGKGRAFGYKKSCCRLH